jgi:CheY-like chemotaxis protein
MVAQILLEGLSCVVDIASNGKETLELLARYHYDLIFMDFGFFDMDAISLTKYIRNHSSTLNTALIPIVGLTAYVNDVDRQGAMDAGMDHILLKPLTKELCIEMLNKFVHEVAYSV